MTQNSSEEGAKRYYQAELGSGSGYYLDDVRGIASWGGRGAKMLRLSGSVEQRDFERLCENRHPGSGERLTARQRPGRTVGYDLTFNAPKSATLLYELGEDKAVLKAFNESVVETMDDIESDALTRVRIGGQYDNRQTANLTWAQFNHFTTRPVNGNLDPHLHAHVFTFNATYDTDESKWKAVQFREINRDMPYYEALFQSRFAAKLNKLGYETEPHSRYFEVKGVSRHSIERFSNRTAEIEQKAQELNLKTPEAKAKLGATTRADKGPAPTIESLRADWTSRLSETELYALKGAKANKPVRTNSPTLEQALEETLADYFGRSAVANERRVVADTLAKNPGAYSELKVQVALANRSGIELTRHQGKNLLVSSEELKTELALVRYVRQGLNQHEPVAPRREVLKEHTTLSAEQNKAVRHLLRNTSSVMAISGKAGTGKTRLMTTAVSELKRRDKSVVVLAPSAQASRGVLRDEGFKQADTVAKFLQDGKFQKQAKNGFIWVDEAGLLSNRDMKAVFDVAKQKNARVILSGDTAQHQAVGVGNPLSTLYRHTPLKPVSLHDIRRQEDEAYRQAVDDLAQGRTAEGLGKLDDAGHIHERTEEHSHQEIAERYRELTDENQSMLVVTPTNREREALTKAIRDELESSGRLSGKAKTFTTYKDRHLSEKEKLLASSYETGDKIYFNSRLGRFKAGEVATVRLVRDDRLGGKHLMVTKRDGVKIRLEKIRLKESDVRKISVVDAEKIELKKGDLIRFTRNANSLSRRWFTKNNYHRVNNGQVATIKSIRGNTIRLTNGLKIDARLGNFTHGYVFTSYASQGQTRDHVLVSQHGDSLGAATNAEQVYVSVSRGRQSVKIYTDDKVRFMKAATRQSDPTTAIDRQEERHERIRVKKFKDWLHRYDNQERVNESGL